MEYSRQWAIRGVHELKSHDLSAYITLTYSDEFFPEGGNLKPEDMQKFLKRLRKYLEPLKLRYFQCGEYGDKTNRPHHHAIIYGYDFPDKEFFKMESGHKLYKSEVLNKIWGKGQCLVGTVTFESCAYVARYIMKKQYGKDVDPDKVQPYITMSRRPGLGIMFYEKYNQEIYQTDSVVIRNREMKPPRAYDNKHNERNPSEYEKIKKIRYANKKPDVGVQRRLEIEKCKLKKPRATS